MSTALKLAIANKVHDVDLVIGLVDKSKIELDGNEYDIPSGSKIIVKQNGITESYTRSGKAAVFRMHQEIPLELFERYA
ncbi:MAG: hypothetical protein ABS903_17440 [Solibacillus sp.]